MKKIRTMIALVSMFVGLSTAVEVFAQGGGQKGQRGVGAGNALWPNV
jgi:hypothetical protein